MGFIQKTWWILLVLSITLNPAAEAVGQNEMLFGRDSCDKVLDRGPLVP